MPSLTMPSLQDHLVGEIATSTDGRYCLVHKQYISRLKELVNCNNSVTTPFNQGYVSLSSQLGPSFTTTTNNILPLGRTDGQSSAQIPQLVKSYETKIESLMAKVNGQHNLIVDLEDELTTLKMFFASGRQDNDGETGQSHKRVKVGGGMEAYQAQDNCADSNKELNFNNTFNKTNQPRTVQEQQTQYQIQGEQNEKTINNRSPMKIPVIPQPSLPQPFSYLCQANKSPESLFQYHLSSLCSKLTNYSTRLQDRLNQQSNLFEENVKLREKIAKMEQMVDKMKQEMVTQWNEKIEEFIHGGNKTSLAKSPQMGTVNTLNDIKISTEEKQRYEEEIKLLRSHLSKLQIEAATRKLRLNKAHHRMTGEQTSRIGTNEQPHHNQNVKEAGQSDGQLASGQANLVSSEASNIVNKMVDQHNIYDDEPDEGAVAKLVRTAHRVAEAVRQLMAEVDE